MKKLLSGGTFESRGDLEQNRNTAATPVTRHTYCSDSSSENKPGNKSINPQWASPRVFMGQHRDNVKASRT